LETPGAPVPVALSLSGEWLVHHGADFQWLRDQEHAGALRITWVDHSYHHPYVPGRPLADNFLLTAGTDMRAEILDTERLLIANGETPSVFFRFPGLISNAALMKLAGGYHLIVLGGDAWLAKSPQARPGDIILVHPNGNEPAGLAIFTNLLAAGKLPRPFRPIAEAP
jgi:peptidoglycan/xylan/chitin deacetylase (PgdA/CDA1 family)